MSARPLTMNRAVERRDDSMNAQTYRLETDPRASHAVVREIPVDRIAPSPYQHRVHFDQAKLAELGASYGVHGLGQLQPIIVRPRGEDEYELVAGERRWRAAKLVGLPTIKAIVREMTDAEARVATAAENLLREGLQDWETARAYLDLRALVRGETKRANAGAGLMAAVPGVQHKTAMIQHYLKVGEMISKELLLRAGAATPEDPSELDATVLQGLRITQLMKAASARTEQERYMQLRRSIGAVRATAARLARAAASETVSVVAAEDGGESAQSLGTSGGAMPDASARAGATRTYQQLLEEGGWRKNLAAPFKTASVEDARRHLEQIAPVVAALVSVESQAQPIARALPVEGAPVLVLAVPTAKSEGSVDTVSALRSLLAIERAVVEARDVLVRAARLPEWLAGELLGRNQIGTLARDLKAAEARAERAAWTPGQCALDEAFGREHGEFELAVLHLRQLATRLAPPDSDSATTPRVTQQATSYGDRRRERTEQLLRQSSMVERALRDAGARSAAQAWSAALGISDLEAALGALRSGADQAEDSLATRLPARWDRRRLERMRESKEGAARRARVEMMAERVSLSPDVGAESRSAGAAGVVAREVRPGEETRVRLHRSLHDARGSHGARDVGGVCVHQYRPPAAPRSLELTLRFVPQGERITFWTLPPQAGSVAERRFHLRFEQQPAPTVGADALMALTSVLNVLSAYSHSSTRTKLASSLGLTPRQVRELIPLQAALQECYDGLRELIHQMEARAACDLRLQELAAADATHVTLPASS